MVQRFGSCFISYTENVETLVFDWGTVQFLGEERIGGDRSMSLGAVLLHPGKGHERHNHPDSDEYIYVLSGEGEQMLDDHDPVPVRPGANIYVPRGVFHSTLNTGREPMRLIVVYAPAGAEAVLRGLPDVKILPASDA
jgi:oxalate decarboxylase/phosphoglucose isomerase-like protein (cupin superfamily)